MDVASSRSAAGETCAASRPKGQTSGSTLPAADASHGRRQNESTVDSQGSALVSLAVGFRLRASELRGGCSVMSGGD